MAFCPKCRKQIPDDSAHCGYCGATVRAPEPGEARTMFGYAVNSPPAPAPQRGAPPSQPRPARQASPEAMAKTQFGGGEVASGPDPAKRGREERGKAGPGKPVPRTIMQQGMPAPASLRPSQAHEAQPRQPTRAPVPPTRYAPPSEAAPPPRRAEIPRTAHAPASRVPSAVEIGEVETERPRGGPIPATMASAPAAPVIAPRQAAPPERESTRPVLASESLAEDRAPAEPGRLAMRVLMAVGGLLLVALFAVPVAQSAQGLRFAWDLIPSLSGVALLNQLYLPAAGVLLLAAALLPVPFLARAFTGAILGVGALGLLMAGSDNDWRYVATVSVCFLLPAALLHRWRYRGSLFARLLVAAAVLAVFAIVLVPASGSVPLLSIFSDLGSGGAAGVAARLSPVVLLLLGLLSLLAFLGSGSTGLVQVWAVCLLFYLPLQGGLALLGAQSGKDFFAQLPLLQSALALLIYLTLAANGLSQIMAASSRSARYPLDDL